MAVITFTKIPYTDPDLNRPGAGAEQWHGQNTVNIPTEGTNTQRLDVYQRSPLTWAKIEKAKNQYDWSPVIATLKTAIDKKQRVSFGFMSLYHDNEDGVINYDGGNSAYPLYLHQEMQSEAVKDWRAPKSSNGWVPNWNSHFYIDAQRRFNTSLNTLLETGSYNGVKYRDVINSIDVRGYGNYGEWHLGGIVDQVSEIPAGAKATAATLKAIIDAHTQTLPNFQLSIIMTAFDYFLQHTMTSPEVGYYALTTSNAYGKLGWRRDNWGAGDGTGDTYIDDLLIDNVGTWNGVQLKTLIMPVYKYAPVSGEPMNSTSNSFAEFEAQVKKYHANSFGNGNITTSPSATIKSNFRAASKAAGYRLLVENVDITPSGKNITTKVAWKNEGACAPYNKWDIIFGVIVSGQFVSIGKSTFNLRLFQPAGISSVAVDTFAANVADGSYEVRFKVVDPVYGTPMPLFITAPKGSDGSYSLGTYNLTGGVVVPPVNKPPVCNAGPDLIITLPTNTATLLGTASDPDGTIKTKQWSQVSGPVAATIVSPANLSTIINFTKDGLYKFRLVVTDNLDASSVDEAQVLVNPAVTVPPVQKKIVSINAQSYLVNYDDGSSEIIPGQ